MTLVTCVRLGLLVWMCSVCWAASKPNVIIFYVDDLGYGDLSPYGHPTSFTPNIQKMADSGLVLTNFYTNSPASSPSRAGLLTGRYQMRSGVYPGEFDPTHLGGLPFNETTIAEALKEVGYSTATVGKWHLGVGEDGKFLPHNHGFDYYLGIPYSHDDCPCYICYYPRGHCEASGSPLYVPCPLMECKNGGRKILQQPANLTSLSDSLLNAATSFIRNKGAKKQPFFLYYAFHHTHAPQFAGRRFVNTSIRGPYGDSLREIDYAVRNVLMSLKKSGCYNNTFVFLTSDNGPALNHGPQGGVPGPLRCGKSTTWEGGVRVPGIAWWPKRISHRRSARLSSTLDLFPTILKMAGARLPQNTVIDGVDMSPILFKTGVKANRDFFAYFPGNASKTLGPYAIRWKKYKVHYYTTGGACSEEYPDEACRHSTPLTLHTPPLLYDLHSDPQELYPLNTKDYTLVMDTITKWKDKFVREMEWNEAQMLVGKDRSIQPCGNPGCSPFPYCCRANTMLPRGDQSFPWL